MQIKRAIFSAAAALGVAAVSFGVAGAAAPAAEAGLMCQAKISKAGVSHAAYSVCKGYSGNDYRQVRAVAYCKGDQTVYGPWKWNGAKSTAPCPRNIAINRAGVQLK
ncbi:hypothetical protein CLV63_11749 [Murinocardiopsis flavida]|uniref:Uncharacterized protein n=1 Tax=Murinocardiopsis flavida TaxID=645275 RepID=A0A2P8D6J8_9ACTN|nr:hypothetical protein [Murinocardiopsis flavida]PSK92844.1 hypothetical protein CLV63_11749 [Murinocardiopsis flavida]